MLARHLHPLDRRQQTLLLTMMSFAGSQAGELYDLLPDDEAAALRDKASKLEEIPRDKRVAIMIRELKGLMGFRSLKGLDGVEPSWLASGFKGESPRVVAVALMHMPSSLARQITARLPEAVQRAMPSREELRGVPLEVAKLIRARYDRRFATMPLDRELDRLAFPDVVMLSARELITVVRGLGADEIAAAFLAVGKRALAEFLSKLPTQDGEELIAAVKRADMKDSMEARAAQAFIGKVLTAGMPTTSGGRSSGVVAFANTEELFQKAGLFRLARALSVEDPAFIRQLTQRLPRAHGRLLLEYLERARERAVDDGQVRRLRDHVVAAIGNLARRGKIDARYGNVPAQFEAR